MKHELQNIISGKSQVSHGDTIQAISHYLRESQSPSRTIKSGKQIKSEEAALINNFATKVNFGTLKLTSMLLFPAVLRKRFIFIRMSLRFLNSMIPFIIASIQKQNQTSTLQERQMKKSNKNFNKD